jgi:acetyl esterase/lipase
MRTIPRELFRHVLVRGLIRNIFDPDRPAPRQRAMIEALGAVHRLPRQVRREDTTLGGRPAEKLTPRDASERRVILYFHGGGYIVGSTRTHRALAAHLADASGCAVFALDYRLAPEHPHPAALDDAEAAFHALAAEFDEVVLGGDSAGGGLAIALAIRLHAADGRTPVALGLISPWIDLTGEHGIVDRDDMLKRTWSDACAAAYAGSRPIAELVPAVADLAGLPPTTIHVGDTEMLLPDAEWLAEGLRSAGVPVELRVVPRMWHIWHLHAGLFGEATEWARTLGRALSGTKGSLT